MKTLAWMLLLFGLGAVPASAVSVEEDWRVIGRATDAGDQVAVVAAAKRRTTTLAVRVRVTGQPKTAKLHTVVTCSKVGPFGVTIFSRRDEFAVTAPALRVLPLPVRHPENCGVTAIGQSNSILRRVGDTVYSGRITVQILARCIVQTNAVCI
jgi:hypothetical protein